MLSELLFPKFCLGCNKLGLYICSSCEKKLQYSLPIRLQKPNPENFIQTRLSIYQYNYFFKKILKTVKYRLATSVLKELFLTIRPEVLHELSIYKKLHNEYVLQPIPLHAQRLRERGFNQALLIAEFFQTYLDMPVVDSLTRVRQTDSQAQTNSVAQRWNNMKYAFAIKNSPSIKTKNVILVDDVMTSGATITTAATILRQSGAQSVHALTLAQD